MTLPGIYVDVAIGILLLLISWMLKVTTDTRSEVRKINGRLGRVEEWRQEFTRTGDERQRESQRRLENLEKQP